MALSPPVARKHLHTRRYVFKGFHREDGLWDIEGHMTDTKTYGFHNEHRGDLRPGDPVHDMWMRLTLDDDLTLRDIEVATAAGPYALCGAIAPKYAAIKGARIAPGWRNKVKALFGGAAGCTHHTEMLMAIATVAYQTIYSAKKKWDGADKTTGKPFFIDSCHALGSGSDLVKKHYPEYYTGPQ